MPQKKTKTKHPKKQKGGQKKKVLVSPKEKKILKKVLKGMGALLPGTHRPTYITM